MNADQFLKTLLTKNLTPSVQYLFFDKEVILHQFRAGLADIENQRVCSDQTTYCAFSVTKTFTSLAVLQLAEKKLVDIEDQVKRYLPNFPYSSKITIRHLLSHSSGIPNPNPLSWIHLAAEHDAFDRDEFFKKHIFPKHSKTKFDINEKFLYSNLGYLILGQVIEAITNGSYEDYVRDHIIKPLGLSPQQLDFKCMTPQHAKGYQKKWSPLNLLLGLFIQKAKFMEKTVGIWKPFKTNYVHGAAYGGLIGTPLAFAIYVQELLKRENILITQRSRTQLFTEHLTKRQKRTGMCLGWFKGKIDGRSYFAHAGGGGGYYCEIRIYPEFNLGSVIMLNRTGIRDERILDKPDKTLIDAHTSTS